MSPVILFLAITGFSLSLVSRGGDFIDVTGEPWLDPASLHVTVNSSPVKASLSARGTSVGVLLSVPVSAGDTVLITADTLSVSVPKSFALNMRPMDTEAGCVLPQYRFGTSPVPEGLYISGSKKLGVSVGSGGGISQGTELAISGVLAPGITVNGRITDRDLPAGVSSSEAISELDRIYLELQGNSWNAEMGDLEWSTAGVVPWRSDLSGFSAGIQPVSPVGVSGGYGTTGTERRSTTFTTSEGLQGPYVFEPSGGVTPGSERVFLDGEVLSRGSGADYEMDYAAGEITFTTSRLIRRDQRVEISWYRQGDGFRKNLSRGELALELPWEIQVEFSGFSRKDDTGAPLGFVMTDEIEETLAAAGEDPAEAWVDGGTWVGEGNGSYTVDSLFRYVWTGPGNGDWSVEFQKPPQGQGDYLYNSTLGGYVWAGEEQGTHLPRRYVTIPSSSELLGFQLNGAPLFLDSLGVHSFYTGSTGNLFDEQGTLRRGTLSGGNLLVRPWSAGPLLSLSGRFISEGFNPPDGLDTDSDLERWGLPWTWTGMDSYLMGEVSGESAAFSLGRRFLEEGGSSDIAGFSMNGFTGPFRFNLDSRGVFRTGSSALVPGKMGDVQGDLQYAAGSFTPFIRPEYRAESWEDSLSGGVLTITAGTLHSRGSWESSLSAGGEFDRRSGITHADRTLRISLSTRGNGATWNTSGSVQHSTGWFQQGGSTSSDAVNLSFSGRLAGVWAHSRYTAGGYVSRELDIVYTWVGQGNGNYSYDPDTGEYYQDPSGDYAQSFVPGQGDTRVLEAALKGGFSWADSSGSAGIDGSIGLSAENPDRRLETYTLAGAFDTGSPGGWEGSLAPYLAWEDDLLRKLTLKFTGFDRREDYSGAGVTREFYRRLEVIPVLRPDEMVEVRLQGFTASRRRTLYGVRQTDENGLSVDPVLLFPWGLDAGVEFSAENRREVQGELNATSLGVEPHMSLGAAGWTATGRFGALWLPDDDELPSWFFDGRTAGWTLEPSVNLGRNLGRWFRLGIYYWGRKLPGDSWQQRAGLEGTVNF